MAQAVSFGQITIMDLTDLGSLSVYPTANQPLSVIYSPDQNTFTPNWQSSNLILTPVIYYGGNQLTAASAGVTVTWKKQEGSSAEADLGSGETVSNGVLTVSANKFTANSTMISYIVRVQYIEPNSQATLRAEGKITFSLVKQGTSGESAVILQLNTPQGNVFRDGTGKLTIEGILYRGSENVSSSATWTWAKYVNSDYQSITGGTSSIEIDGTTVDSFASYRCIATYDGKSYTAYASLIDKTDPIQVEVLSSIGDQIVNGTGAGAFYVLVYKNGVEVDPIKSKRFLTSAPSSATAGDLYYRVDTTNKTLTLKRYNGSSWVNQSVTYSGTYNWTHMDKDGNTITGPATKGKVIYVDGTLFDKKMISTVEVTI